MTLEPTSIAARFEDVIVQNVPSVPSNSEHSFVTCRAPLRGKDAAAGAAPPGAVAATPDRAEVALGLVGTPLPLAQPMAASAPTQRHPITTRFIARKIANFMAHSSALSPIFLLPSGLTHRYVRCLLHDALERVAYMEIAQAGRRRGQRASDSS